MTATPTTHATAEALRAFWADGQPRTFVDGEWCDPAATAPTHDPSTGDVIADAPISSAAEVVRAVEAARHAQRDWAAAGLEARADALQVLAARLAERGEELALLESMDSGNPLFATRRDVSFGLRYLARWPSYAFAQAGRATTPVADGLSYTLSSPYGVVGRIVAFNHPSLFAVAGLIFPLLAGNTIVIKAAPQTPLGTLALGALLRDSLPPGVVNLVAGGAETGDALVTSPQVKRLSFVGSLPTALNIQSRLSVSGTVKHLSLELGGKNAMIVFPDVQLDAAVEAAVAGMSFKVSAGQSCQSTSRLLIHADIYEPFVALLAQRMEALRVGVAYDPVTDMGPLVSGTHLARVRDYIDSGIADGARLVTGGRTPAGLPGGHYLEPTLFADVDAAMAIAREEIFGPVVAAMPWRDYDEMLSVANDVELGLSAAVWSRDIDAALRTAAEVEAGYVWVNDANRHYLGAPFGGVKNSGLGREESPEELLSYLETKSVNVRLPLRPDVASERT
jgi:acyl-CoA reductase-like NAD-dependent aldehyde dehydrogenase